MRKEINRLHDKVDKMDEKLDHIDKHLSVYNEQLKIHIKRTELLEADVAPIKEHIIQLKTITKIGMLILGASGTLAGILKYFGVI